jgi:hypothetical protein
VIVLEVIVLLVALIVAARSRPPKRHVSPRVMSLLAAVALLAFGVAMSTIVIVASELVFGVALLLAGAAGCAFLYLARGWADDDEDDDDGEPPVEPAGDDGEHRRFQRKARAPKTPAPR